MKLFTKFILLFLFLNTTLWAQSNSFQVSANVFKAPKDLTILFKKIRLNSNIPTVLDTIKHKKGRFRETFNYEPGIYQVDFQGVTKVNFAVEHGQVIAISVDLRPNKSNPVVDCMGSFDAEYVFQYDKLRKKTFAKLVKPVRDKLKELHARGDVDSIAVYTQIEDQKMAEYSKTLADFAKTYFENSIAQFYAAIRLDPDRDLDFMEKKSEWFTKNRPELSLTKQLAEKVERFKRIALGQPAPPVELPDPDGKMVTLEDYKGSYVLLDFWASWCLPCRQENLNYVRQYEKYEDDNLEFLSISIDTNKALWQQAVQKDGIEWVTVADLKGWDGETVKAYDVNTIPANFLIDPAGKIIAKNLRGLALNKRLAEIFD